MKFRLEQLLFVPLAIGLLLLGSLLLAIGLLMTVAYAADPTGTNTQVAFVTPSYTFATLPPTKAGTIAYMTDGATGNCGDAACTTFGTAVTGGGGALKLLIWYDNSGWTLIGK